MFSEPYQQVHLVPMTIINYSLYLKTDCQSCTYLHSLIITLGPSGGGKKKGLAGRNI